MRRLVPTAALAIALLIGGITSASAEPVGQHFELTPFGGYTIFDGEGYQGTGTLGDDLYVGGRLGYQWSPWLGLEFAGGYTPTAQEGGVGSADVNFTHGSASFMLTPFAGRYGGPFISLGGGASQLKVSGAGDAIDQGNAEAAAGIRMWLTDAVGLRLEARDIMWLGKDDMTNPLTHTLVMGGGLTFALGGKPRDTDGDGVPDRKDKCPDTPVGATVNTDGCPSDTDGDAVLDGLDACPNTPKGAQVDAKGCPSDSDGDGVFNGIDACADTPKGARVDPTGCPSDGDGDGVLDGIDQCEGTPKGATVDERGCPKDGDGDGVADGIDQCPDTSPGLKVDATGCPIELIERETELLDTGMIRLQDVNFTTGKADILPESQGTLDVVGQVLTKWPELRIEIGGHTDSRGSNAANQKLSEARARSVLNYLLQKFPGLKGDQFSVKGYGEAKPLLPNTNDLNMAKNRRVEFVVLNKDVLKREVERRRLLQKSDAPAPAPAPAPADTTRGN